MRECSESKVYLGSMIWHLLQLFARIITFFYIIIIAVETLILVGNQHIEVLHKIILIKCLKAGCHRHNYIIIIHKTAASVSAIQVAQNYEV
jgi:hypothetical protein